MSGVSLLTVETGQTYSMKRTVYRQHQPCKEAPTAVDVSKPWLLVHIVIISSFYASCSKCHPLWWVSKEEVIEGKTNTSIDISGHGTFSGQVHFSFFSFSDPGVDVLFGQLLVGLVMFDKRVSDRFGEPVSLLWAQWSLRGRSGSSSHGRDNQTGHSCKKQQEVSQQ